MSRECTGSAAPPHRQLDQGSGRDRLGSHRWRLCRDRSFVPVEWDPADATLRRRADLHRSVCARPGRSSGRVWAASGRRLPRRVLLRGSGPGAARRPGLQHRLHLVVRRRRRPNPGQPDSAHPKQRPLDAAGVDHPAPNHVAARANASGIGHPVRDHRLTRRTDDVAARPRDRLLAASGFARGDHRGRTGSGNHLHGPARQPGALSTARNGCALADRARPQGPPLVVCAGRVDGRPGLAGSKRRRTARRSRRTRFRMGSMARLAIRRRPKASHSMALRVRLLRPLPACDGALVRAPAGRLRQRLAVDHVGPNPVHPDDRADGQRHRPDDPGQLPRSGHRAAAPEPRARSRLGACRSTS